MDIRAHNRAAWDKQVDNGNQWTLPVSAEVIEAARGGSWEILLTPSKPVPQEWFPQVVGADVLCLASGGGQQGPVLAAAGANVTVLDTSPKQLEQDRHVAKRESLDLKTVEGDMTDLAVFSDGSFDFIVHPISNLYVSDVNPVWAEAFRVLRPGGTLLSGFTNPFLFLFDDDEAMSAGVLQVRYELPYSDIVSLPPEKLAQLLEAGATLQFSHTLTDLIGGQLSAGFLLTNFYEDSWSATENAPLTPLTRYMPLFIATRAVKPNRVQK